MSEHSNEPIKRGRGRPRKYPIVNSAGGKPSTVEAPMTWEIGSSGLRRSGGRIDEEWLNDLKGAKAARVYREMADSEPVIAATLLIFEMLLRQTEVRLDTADDSPQAEMIRDFCQTALDDADGGWDGLLSQALQSLTYGFALVEQVYKIRRGPDALAQFRSKYNDGRWGWRKFAGRSAASIDEWDYDAGTDDISGAWQISPSDYQRHYLPMDRLLHFRLRAQKSNPEGYSLLRPAYTSYYYAKNIRFVEATGIERQINGMPVMEVPLDTFFSTTTTATSVKDGVKDFLRKIRQDESLGAMVPASTGTDGNPTGWKFSLLAASGSGSGGIESVIRRYESRMAMAMLTEVMLLGSDAMGSYALSKDKTELLVVGLGGVMRSVLSEVNGKMLPQLARLNGWPTELAPTMSHGQIKSPNLADLGAFISAMSSSGMITPDQSTEDAARKLAGLPEAEAPSRGLAPRRNAETDATETDLYASSLAAVPR